MIYTDRMFVFHMVFIFLIERPSQERKAATLIKEHHSLQREEEIEKEKANCRTTGVCGSSASLLQEGRAEENECCFDFLPFPFATAAAAGSALFKSTEYLQSVFQSSGTF